MTGTATVYGLLSSRDGVVRYIGQTKGDVWARFRQHTTKAESPVHPGAQARLYSWMQAEIATGHRIKLSVIKRNAVWDVDESAAIEAAGDTLLNRGPQRSGDREEGLAKRAEKLGNIARGRYYNRLYCGQSVPGNRSAARLLVKYAMGQYRP